jgi:glycosyltransferase involved in cell wall biosynthesis
MGANAMTAPAVSLILPFHRQAAEARGIVQGHVAMLIAYEIILVPNGSTDETDAVCRALGAELPGVRCLAIDGSGWGRAVRAGIAAAEGTIICYANSARTQPDDLARILDRAMQSPGLVVKATRVHRHSPLRRLGSLLYNALCTTMLRLPTRDVNGTPKAFPRSAAELRELRREDDLIDLEFMWRCATAGLPVAEIPVATDRRYGGRSTTSLATAWRLYTGAVRFWWQVRHADRAQ